MVVVSSYSDTLPYGLAACGHLYGARPLSLLWVEQLGRWPEFLESSCLAKRALIIISVEGSEHRLLW